MRQARNVKKLSFKQRVKMWWEIRIGIRYSCCTYYKRNGHKHGCKLRKIEVKPEKDWLESAICNGCKLQETCVQTERLQPNGSCEYFVGK